MPYYHCIECHHEFEAISENDPKCDWCGAESHILEDKTPLEKMCDVIEEMGISKWFK